MNHISYHYVTLLLHILTYSEIIRVIESLQLTEKYKVATPVDWKVGIRNLNFFY